MVRAEFSARRFETKAIDSKHSVLLIPNSGGTLRLEQQDTTEQLKHRGLNQQMDDDCLNINKGEKEQKMKSHTYF